MAAGILHPYGKAKLLASHVVGFDTIAIAACMPVLFTTGDGLPCNESDLSQCHMDQAQKKLT